MLFQFQYKCRRTQFNAINQFVRLIQSIVLYVCCIVILQLISWLRPISEHADNDNSLLSITVRSATAWCDGYTVPLLVPLTGWLPVPLPSQIRTMTVSGTGPIRAIAVAPSKQHLIISPTVGDAQLWHIMSNSIVHTFKG